MAHALRIDKRRWVDHRFDSRWSKEFAAVAVASSSRWDALGTHIQTILNWWDGFQTGKCHNRFKERGWKRWGANVHTGAILDRVSNLERAEHEWKAIERVSAERQCYDHTCVDRTSNRSSEDSNWTICHAIKLCNEELGVGGESKQFTST